MVGRQGGWLCGNERFEYSLCECCDGCWGYDGSLLDAGLTIGRDHVSVETRVDLAGSSLTSGRTGVGYRRAVLSEKASAGVLSLIGGGR